jgi:hypothetical protein
MSLASVGWLFLVHRFGMAKASALAVHLASPEAGRWHSTPVAACRCPLLSHALYYSLTVCGSRTPAPARTPIEPENSMSQRGRFIRQITTAA